jgi:hypothetical protein
MPSACAALALVVDGAGAEELVQIWSTCGPQLLSKIKVNSSSASLPQISAECLRTVTDFIARLSSPSSANAATIASASSVGAAAAGAALQQLLAIAAANTATVSEVADACSSIIRYQNNL